MIKTLIATVVSAVGVTLAQIVIGPEVLARPTLEVEMRVGLSINPNYWYILALSSNDRSGPRANITNPDVSLMGNEVAFVSDWDYIIRIKPIDSEGLIQATVEEEGGTEQDFLTGFNEARIRSDVRDYDTISLVVDLEELTRLNADEEEIHVGLVTIESPFVIDPEETNIALDATSGDRPNFHILDFEGRERITEDDPQLQRTLRRSRQMLSDSNTNASLQSIGAADLAVLAANIVAFDLHLIQR